MIDVLKKIQEKYADIEIKHKPVNFVFISANVFKDLPQNEIDVPKENLGTLWGAYFIIDECLPDDTIFVSSIDIILTQHQEVIKNQRDIRIKLIKETEEDAWKEIEDIEMNMDKPRLKDGGEDESKN